jgi:hypothetical protein
MEDAAKLKAEAAEAERAKNPPPPMRSPAFQMWMREQFSQRPSAVGTPGSAPVGVVSCAPGPIADPFAPTSSADPVSRSYPPGFPFKGGTILGVGVDIGEDQYLDLEREAAAAFARD